MDLYLGLPIFELHPQNLRWKQHKLSKTFKDHQKASKMMILYTSFDQSCYMFCCVSPAATGSSPLLPFTPRNLQGVCRREPDGQEEMIGQCMMNVQSEEHHDPWFLPWQNQAIVRWFLRSEPCVNYALFK
jgi:hypothetical protein